MKIDSWQMPSYGSPGLSEPLRILWFKHKLELFLENLMIQMVKKKKKSLKKFL